MNDLIAARWLMNTLRSSSDGIHASSQAFGLFVLGSGAHFRNMSIPVTLSARYLTVNHMSARIITATFNNILSALLLLVGQ